MIGLSRLDERKDNRMPITLDILKALVQVLPLVCRSLYEATLFTAIFVTAFYGYFRIGELVQNSITDIGHAVQLQDITFGTDNKSVTINLKHSKIDQEGKGAVVNIKSVDKHLCPVLSLRKFLRLRPKAMGSLFCHVNGAPVTRYQTASVFNQSLVRLGLDTHIYKLHSFRTGAATHAWSTVKEIVCLNLRSFVEPRRIWILGSSIIKHAFVHVKNSHIGSNLQLHRHNASVLWQGMGGMRSHQLIRKVRTLLKYEEAPYMHVIHCGGNDIGQILKSVELRATIKRILDKLVVLLPNTILVWSQILPRLHWRGEIDHQALEKTFMLKNAMIGLSRLDERKDNRMPITLDILKALVQVLPLVCRSLYEATLFTAIFVTAFYGYFRIGELVQNSITDIGHAVQLQDITFGTDNKSVTINLKHSKIDQEGKGAVVNIKSVDKHLCPVLSLRKFLRLRPKAMGSLFCHVNGAPVTRYQTASVFNQSQVRSFVEPRRIWILGSSIIKHAFVHVKNSHIGSNLQLHRHNASVLWQGMGGIRSHQLIRKVRTLLKYKEAPYMHVIHCGGNDIGQILKSVELRATIKRILDKLVVPLPNTILVWSQILPRLHWRGEIDHQALEKVRVRINSHIATYLTKIGGKYIRYPELDIEDPTLYKDDAVHLNLLGNDLFINRLQQGLQSFLEDKCLNVSPRLNEHGPWLIM
uniref:SGNH hydrolase-type esterase domain-containing protein n=1 Tax=Magallana gigas TaxID=29159 RepID=A0A8W8MMU3_MAGGI